MDGKTSPKITLEDLGLRAGRYRHFKGGEYQLLDAALHSETLEPMVIYRALYGQQGLWVRPAGMWSEQVQYEGHTVTRFTLMEELL